MTQIDGKYYVGHSAISSAYGRKMANTKARKSGKKDYSRVAEMARANSGK